MKKPQAQPIPGYSLIEPLGRGGFGEVWKCEAPGGLFKAIKFVGGASKVDPAAGNGMKQELEALHRIKAIRHPFLLSMDRIEVIGDELVIVMELADTNLLDLFRRHQAAGKAGLPRDDLLGFLWEAAEVLDLMNLQYELQHLDIKPANLFLISNHVKVADFGLVKSLQDVNAEPVSQRAPLGISPLYAPPERFLGSASSSSDQYSLAITYHELLTGQRPFPGKTFAQLLLQHIKQEPDLSLLPATDRKAVARALSKTPDARFPSCTDFLRALVADEARSSAGQLYRSSVARARVARTAEAPAAAPGVRNGSDHLVATPWVVPRDEEAPEVVIRHVGGAETVEPCPTISPDDQFSATSGRERRMQERLPYDHPVKIFAALSNDQAGEAMDCQGRDISPNGMVIRAPERPPTSQVYVELKVPHTRRPVRTVARVMRVQAVAGDSYDLGLLFLTPLDPVLLADLLSGQAKWARSVG
jgi:serine/threonine protein kinase